jgi:UDP-N-acetylglucosamine 4,6-dehydratase
MSFTLDGNSLLVTGATGSFGNAFVRRVLRTTKVARLVVYSRDELKQYEMRERLDNEGLLDDRLRFFIGDVRDGARLQRALSGVKVVIHAAALKQVPTAEYNPMECIKTNVLGAENVVEAAIDQGVERVIALSSDKAANPINLYGASKLCSDKLFVAANHLAGFKPTRFSVVRYGNVVGSRGSVVSLFHRLAEAGQPIPITDEQMTRFWLTVEQGVDFVLASLGRMAGGEMFVPKLPSMKVVDVARAVAPGARHTIVGIRPGEKLHEIMITRDDASNTVEFDDYYVIKPAFSWWEPREAGNGAFKAGRPVADGFQYSSDSNDRWLDAEAFRRMTGLVLA